MVPAKLRAHFEEGVITLTQAVDPCLWIFVPEEWRRVYDNLTESTNLFQAKARLIQRRIIAPAQETEFDRTGRVTVSPSLRAYANLHKECVILGMGSYLEIWDVETYRNYWAENEPEFQDAVEELGRIIS